MAVNDEVSGGASVYIIPRSSGFRHSTSVRRVDERSRYRIQRLVGAREHNGPFGLFFRCYALEGNAQTSDDAEFGIVFVRTQLYHTVQRNATRYSHDHWRYTNVKRTTFKVNNNNYRYSPVNRTRCVEFKL